MARYKPKHLKQKKKRYIEIRKRIGFILTTISFIVFVTFSTAYSIFIYPTTLPKVEVMKMEGTNHFPTDEYSFPMNSIQHDESGNKYYCYYVSEEPGGWGYRYWVHRKEVVFSGNETTNNHVSVLLIGGHDSFFYVVSDVSGLSQGDEVTILSVIR